MEFKTHLTEEIDIIYTGLKGSVDAEFEKLVEKFGEPIIYENDPGNKTDAEWYLLFEDGNVATIYNYKNGINYLGEEAGLDVDSITDWHIGGFNDLVVEYIHKILGDEE